MKVSVPIRTGRGGNDRAAHWRVRHREVKRIREAVGVVLLLHGRQRPEAGSYRVRLTRSAPSSGLDGDNLQGSLKAVRDEVAQWLGLDDRDPRIEWVYGQKRGEWGVEIEVMANGP